MPPASQVASLPDSDEDTFWKYSLWIGIIMLLWVVVIIAIYDLNNDSLKSLHTVGLLEGPWHHDKLPKWGKLTGLSNDFAGNWRDRSSSSDDSYSSSSSSSSSSGGSFGGGRASGGGASCRW